MTYRQYFTSTQWASANILLLLAYIGISLPLPLIGPLFLKQSTFFMPGTDLATRSLAMGVALAAYPIGQLAGTLVFAGLSDRLGRRRVLMPLLWGSAAAYMLSGLAIEETSLTLFIIARLVTGILEATSALIKATVASAVSSTSDRVRLFGVMDASISIGYVLGPVVGGLALSYVGGYASPFYMVGMASIVAAFSTWRFFPKDIATTASIQTCRESQGLIQDYKQLLTDSALIKPLAFAALCFMANTLFVDFLAAYMTSRFQVSQDYLVFTFIWLSALWGLGSLIPGFLVTRICAVSATRYALAIAGAGALGLVISKSLPFFCSFLFGLTIGISAGVVLIMVLMSNQTTAETQGKLMGITQATRLAGDSLILLTGGGLFALGNWVPFTVAGVIWLTAALWLARGSLFRPPLSADCHA